MSNFADATDLAAATRSGKQSAVQTVSSCLSRIHRYNPSINAFTLVLADRARAQAERLDADIRAGRPAGPLAGIPFAVKNLFDIREQVTVAGSLINRGNPPATQDALLVQRLEQAGAILVGALNMGEYAYDFTGENVHDGHCRNPWDTSRMSGGSSSGSGAALAAGLVPLTLGSDTNGSIRVPSSLCGVFGLKPTYGRLPRTGTYPFCDSLDHLGPMARSARDLATIYDQMQGSAATDHACTIRPFEPCAPGLADAGESLRGIRIAVLRGYFGTTQFPNADRAVAAVAEALAEITGARPTDVELPLAAAGRSAAFIITNMEAAALHQQRLRTRPDDFDPAVRDRLLAGTLLPGAWYLRAQAVRERYSRAATAMLRDVDLLIAPATPCNAPPIGDKTMLLGDKEVGVRANLGYFTQPISCIGLPVCCVPVAGGSAMPIGVQLIGAPWREDHCLLVAAALERTGAVRAPIAPGFDLPLNG